MLFESHCKLIVMFIGDYQNINDGQNKNQFDLKPTNDKILLESTALEFPWNI